MTMCGSFNEDEPCTAKQIGERLERDLPDGASSALIGEAKEMVAIRQ